MRTSEFGRNLKEIGAGGPMNTRKAEICDYDLVRSLYWNIIDNMQNSEFHPGWEKGVYPADDFIRQSLQNQQLYILEDQAVPVGCMVLNHEVTDGYEKVAWAVQAAKEEVTVIHALGVLPSVQDRGYASFLVKEAVRIAREHDQKVIRLDVLGGNIPAQRLYEKIGFQYKETLQLFYEDTGLTDFLMYELVL
jgi:ribosomal protein S18 acetylase RimI-like enzyme